LGNLLQSHLDKLEYKSSVISDESAANISNDDKILAAVETLSNMTDFSSFKITMLAKQASSDSNNVGNCLGKQGVVETVINEEGMKTEVLSVDNLFEATEQLRYAAAKTTDWTRFGDGEYKNGE